MKTVLNYINLLHALARRHRGNGTSKSEQADRRGTAARGLGLSLCLSLSPYSALLLLSLCLRIEQMFYEEGIETQGYSRWHHRL